MASVAKSKTPGVRLLAVCVLALIQASSQAGAAAETLHVLIVADTDDATIGESVAADVNTVRTFFRDPSNVPSFVPVKTLQGEQFNQEDVLAAIDALPTGPENRYLLYYVGHGQYDTEQGHSFLIPGLGGSHSLPRQRVLQRLKRGRPKLAVLISDCCSSTSGKATKEVAAPPRHCRQVVEDLFYDARYRVPQDTTSDPPRYVSSPISVVNVNSCVEGQQALGHLQGGVFTYQLFHRLLPQGAERLEQQRELSTRDGFLTWRELFVLLIPATEKAFQEMARGGILVDNKSQIVQTPQAFELPYDAAREPKSPYTLGVFIDKDYQGRGAKVQATRAGDPAAEFLRPGDVIKKLDGKSVRNWQDFDCLIDFSSGLVEIVWERNGKRMATEEIFYRELVEFQVQETSQTNDDYVTWAPTPCRVRLKEGSPQRSDMTIVLTNDPPGAAKPLGVKGLILARLAKHDPRAAAAGNGDIQFGRQPAGQPTTITLRDTLELKLPGDGSWVRFLIAGKFGRPSSEDKDAVILWRRESPRGAVVGTHALMVRVRKAAHRLSEGERERFLAALAALCRHGTPKGKRYEHYRATHGHRRARTLAAGPAFLPWQRALLLDFERALQTLDPSVSLPYFDWAVPADSVFDRQFMGAAGGELRVAGAGVSLVEFDPLNPIAQWTSQLQTPRRGDGRQLARKPPHDLAMEQGLLYTPVADRTAFTAGIETAHSQFHVWVGGWMGAPGTAARDPVFFLHQANIDRWWATWQRRHNGFGRSAPRHDESNLLHSSGGDLENEMWPWNAASPDGILPVFEPGIAGTWPRVDAAPRPRDMMDYLGVAYPSANLGYCYDDLAFGASEPPTSPSTTESSNMRAERIDRETRLILNRNATVIERVQAMNRLPAEAIVDCLVEALREPGTPASQAIGLQSGADVKTAALARLQSAVFSRAGREAHEEIRQVFRSFILSPNEELRGQALAPLMLWHDAPAIATVKEQLQLKRGQERIISEVEAIRLLSLDDARNHLDAIRPYVTDGEPDVRAEAIHAIGAQLARRSDQRTILAILQDRQDDALVREAALKTLETDASLAAKQSILLLRDTDEAAGLRLAALDTLAGIVCSQVRGDRLHARLPRMREAPLARADKAAILDTAERVRIAELLREISGSPVVCARANRLVQWMEEYDPALGFH